MPTMLPVTARTIVSEGSGYMRDYDATLSPYSGCAFGCHYCYVPTLHFHRRLAPSWGQVVRAKVNAPALLRAAARRGELEGKWLYLSPVTDPYQPAERTYRLTRGMLEVLVALVTPLPGLAMPRFQRDDTLRQVTGEMSVSTSCSFSQPVPSA